MGTLAWECWFGSFSLGSLIWEFRLGKFSAELWLGNFGNFSLGVFAWSFRLDCFSWGTSMGSFAWGNDFGILSLETSVCDPSFGNFRLNISVGNFHLRALQSLGHFRFGPLVSELSHGIFRLIYSAWAVSIGSFRLGSFA